MSLMMRASQAAVVPLFGTGLNDARPVSRNPRPHWSLWCNLHCDSGERHSCAARVPEENAKDRKAGPGGQTGIWPGHAPARAIGLFARRPIARVLHAVCA
jgi:hypothetical protein